MKRLVTQQDIESDFTLSSTLKSIIIESHIEDWEEGLNSVYITLNIVKDISRLHWAVTSARTDSASKYIVLDPD